MSQLYSFIDLTRVFFFVCFFFFVFLYALGVSLPPPNVSLHLLKMLNKQAVATGRGCNLGVAMIRAMK